MDCVACGSAAVTERPECTARGYRRFRCRECGKQYNERSGGLLNHTQYPSDVIALVVLWRLRYRLTCATWPRCFSSAGSSSVTKRSARGRRSSRRCWPVSSAGDGMARAVPVAADGMSTRHT